MFNLLFILLFGSCMTNKKMLEKAKTEIVGQCLEEVQFKMERNGCYDVEYCRGRTQIVFRCSKPDIRRNNFWDTWWFRLTSSIQEWKPELIETVEKHTICIDGRHRIEAYPPEEK